MFHIKPTRLFLPAAALMLAAANFACDDNTNSIGSSLTQGDVSIHIDTTLIDLNATSVDEQDYDSRSGSLMIGNIDVPQFGALSCSFVSRLLPVASLPLADTLPLNQVDSCKVFVRVLRGNITGDSLAPQRLAVYKLNKQLPADIINTFDPTGYYDPTSPLGTKSYVMSNIGKGDTAYIKGTYIPIDVPVPVEVARDAFEQYKENPSIFQWPQTFAEYFPGLYIKSTFGKGCVSTVSQLMLVAYFNYNLTKELTSDGVTRDTVYNIVDSVALFSATPEVLSSNNIHLKVAESLRQKVADGKIIVTTPGGYVSRIKFPAQQLMDQYRGGNKNLSILSSLVMNLPASKIDNDYSIGTTPYLLMVRTKDLATFFKENKLPDNKTSFSAPYDPYSGQYSFTLLRDYLLSLIEKGTVTDEDTDFTLVPVNLTGETSGTGEYEHYYVTKCLPYMEKPTMTLLDTEKAQFVLTFSSQEL